jgi:hypothetical protein
VSSVPDNDSGGPPEGEERVPDLHLDRIEELARRAPREIARRADEFDDEERSLLARIEHEERQRELAAVRHAGRGRRRQAIQLSVGGHPRPPIAGPWWYRSPEEEGA